MGIPFKDHHVVEDNWFLLGKLYLYSFDKNYNFYNYIEEKLSTNMESLTREQKKIFECIREAHQSCTTDNHLKAGACHEPRFKQGAGIVIPPSFPCVCVLCTQQ